MPGGRFSHGAAHVMILAKLRPFIALNIVITEALFADIGKSYQEFKGERMYLYMCTQPKLSTTGENPA